MGIRPAVRRPANRVASVAKRFYRSALWRQARITLTSSGTSGSLATIAGIVVGVLCLMTSAPSRALLFFDEASGGCDFSVTSPTFANVDCALETAQFFGAELDTFVEVVLDDLGGYPGATLMSGVYSARVPFRSPGDVVTHKLFTRGRLFGGFQDLPGSYFFGSVKFESRILDADGNILSALGEGYDLVPSEGGAENAINFNVDYTGSRLVPLRNKPVPGDPLGILGAEYFFENYVTWTFLHENAVAFVDFFGKYYPDGPVDGGLRAKVVLFGFDVPEPGTLALLGIGLVGLRLTRRRKTH